MDRLAAMGLRAGVVALLLAGGCYGSVTPTEPVARLRVVAEPEQASVYVDDRFVGAARVLAVRPKQLKPGRHYITVQAADHFPHDLVVDLEPGLTTVQISLRPVPP